MRDDVGLALSGHLHGRPLTPPITRTQAPRARRSRLPWPALAPALVYAVALVVSFNEVISSVYVNSDAALAPVLGQASAHLPAGSFVSLGNHAWYEEWLFLVATRHLPHFRQLWEVAPLVWSAAGLALLGWSARVALGAWAAGLSVAVLVCVGAFGRFSFLAINWHSLSLVHTAALAAALVWLLPRAGGRSWRWLLGWASLLGLVSAFPTASDTLFPFWALIPVAVAGSGAAIRAGGAERSRIALFTAVTLAVAVAGAVLLAALMRGSGVTSRSLAVAFAPRRAGHNLGLLAESLAFIGGGRLAWPGGGLQSELAAVSGALVVLALAVVAAAIAARLLDRRGRAAATEPERLYVSFWASSLLATCAVYLVTDAPKDVLSGRYLLAAYAAVGALLPLAARGPAARRLLTAGACAFAVIAAYQLIDRPFVVISSPQAHVRFPGPASAAQLVRFARSEGVGHGFAGYWDAEELTWTSGFAVPIRPVRVCSARRHALCYPQLGMVSSWYRPQPGRSLLVVDSPGTSYNGVLAPDPALGRPLGSRRIGYITVYVYGYDIATRLAPPRCGFSWAHPC